MTHLDKLSTMPLERAVIVRSVCIGQQDESAWRHHAHRRVDATASESAVDKQKVERAADPKWGIYVRGVLSCLSEMILTRFPLKVFTSEVDSSGVHSS